MPSNSNVLGEKWFSSYMQLNNDFVELERRFQRRDLTHLDMIKDLTSEVLDLQYKLHILLLLQDNASILISATKDLQKTISYLKHVFNSKEKHLSDQKLKCQVLSTIVTILVTHKSLEENLLLDLIKETRDFIIQIIKTKGRPKVIYSMACNCLEEIEQFFPGLLLSEADALFKACQSQKSAIFQSYASLLSLIVKNAVQMNALAKESTSEQDKKSNVNRIQTQISSTDILDILSATILVIDCVPFVTSMTAYHIMKRLVQIVIDSPDFLPMMFKAYTTRLVFTSDVPLFHLSFIMHKAFGSDLFTVQEEQSLLYQLVSLCCHPAITISHRLLFMEWINDCFDKKDQKFFRWNLAPSQVKFLEISPFDGPDTLEKKLKLLASLSPQRQTSLPVNTLRRFISPDLNIRGCSSLFRTLFNYINMHFNTSLMDKIQRFLLDMIEISPQLSHHVLDLLECVRLKHPESTFAEDTMFNLVQAVTTRPLENTRDNLELSLLILMKASMEKPEICKPKVILLFLKYILQNIPQTEDWFFGNSILAVCSSLLQHHNIDVLYSEIGAILFRMMKFKDVDTRVQAKIYYGLLTSLSSAKIQNVFQGCNQNIGSGQCLSNIATGSSSFHTAHPVQHLNIPILKLSRVPKLKHKSESPLSEDAYMQDELCNYIEEIEGYMESYQDYLSQPGSIPSVSLHLFLEFVDEAEEKFQMLFGVVIKVRATPSCGELKDIEIPVVSRSNLKKGKTVDSTVCIEIYPQVPTPPCLEFRVEFTCHDGRCYQCDIPSITMNFEDLFLPLPVFPLTDEELRHSVCRRKLFDALWTSISINTNKGICYTSSQQSACKLKLSNDQLDSLVKRWEKLRIISHSNVNHTCTYEFGIFVPKCCHILMKITQLRDFVTTNIMTDDYKVLPLLESYFNCLPSSIEMELIEKNDLTC